MTASAATPLESSAPTPDPAEAIAERLVETERLDRRGLERAQRLVVDSRESLLQVLAKLGLATRVQVATWVANDRANKGSLA